MSILLPGNLLIWLPGLLFVAALVYSLIATRRGRATNVTRLAPLGLFFVVLIVAYFVPHQEIAKALRFANAHEAHAGAPVTSYVDIDYAARDAWFKTALPPDERGEDLGSGGDPFSFGDDAESTDRAPESAAVVADPGAAELVYQPEKGIAWMLLMLLFIGGSLFFLQDAKSFLPVRSQ